MKAADGKANSIFFDAKDYELLNMVNGFLERGLRLDEQEGHSLFYSTLHPHGIKELALSHEIRVAYALVSLLDTIEEGQAQERIRALKSLRTEVLATPGSGFRYNTGRVLIQIMKSLIRAHGNTEQQLCLAHDFRRAATGTRRIVRRLLRRYYLLEMPEQWNQVAFDNHVHDARTKGRKSPTHLIMDAWIKGLRKLDLVYYNFVETGTIAEVLQAAEVMGIKVRVGVEFLVLFRGRLLQIYWQPRGFRDYREMLDFFREKPVQQIMDMGREASLYHQSYVLALLANYNKTLRFELGKTYSLELPEIAEADLLAIVGTGQTSRLHLADAIFKSVNNALAARVPQADPDKDSRSALPYLCPDIINREWLGKGKNPDVFLATDPEEATRLPEIMNIRPAALIEWISSIRSPSHITLNLNNMNVEDVLELLYCSQGRISHLEMYNLKNYEDGRMRDLEAISSLQRAINEGSAVALKRLIRNIVSRQGAEPGEGDERSALFLEILRNISKLQDYYAGKPLGTRIGSDSTSRSTVLQGMGFAFVETLPVRVRRLLQKKESHYRFIPFTQELYYRVSYSLMLHQPLGLPLTRALRKLPGLRNFGKLKQVTWQTDQKTASYSKDARTVVTLGGSSRDQQDACPGQARADENFSPGFAYLNTTLTNALKVVSGFSLAMLTFLYTQSWWVLAWGGPIIWFGITGFRNVLQAVLGGGGLRRTPLLRWNDYLSWTRLCDSLLFTGISVPLLELGVRIMLLEGGLGITSLNNPVSFYTIMSLINGLYISGHNIFRGLPQEAVIGNLFRSVVAIPVSVLYNWIALQIFTSCGWPVIYLEQMAAVLSKLSSDTVAALIEGPADKMEYLRRRYWDYLDRFEQLFNCYARLEVLMPEEDTLDLLRRPKDFVKDPGREAGELEKIIIITALDLMYFWMYQPRARSTLKSLLLNMTEDERVIFANAQLVLTRVREISQLLVDGLMGMNFARPLAFYLATYEGYLQDMSALTGVSLLENIRGPYARQY
ncbi:MAG: hypothetical protein LBN33_02490 [Desulfovibrio sp.]|jgi:hypothetical protein|nr:hypothetical protein [Desulfovibrio sp.]